MGSSPRYEAPAPDPVQQAYTQYLLDSTKLKDEQAAADAEQARAAAEAIKAGGVANYKTTKTNIFNQYKAGMITGTEAKQLLNTYEDTFKLGADFTLKAENKIGAREIRQEPRTRKLLVNQTYQDLMGRPATEQEFKRFNRAASTGEYNLENLVTSIQGSQDYQDKFNKSYLENFYDSTLGEKTTVTNPDGTTRDVRTFNYDSSFDPLFSKKIKKGAGIGLPTGPQSFTGTVQEIEDFQQRMRQSREFAYNAGLTNLQGQIDKDTQKIKNEGTQDVTRIASQGQLLSNLTSGFWS